MRSDLPTFLVVGAMKAGTTTLHERLGQHPDVFMSDPKELHYFTGRENWAKGVDWYRSQFAAGRDAVARGESSPSYSQADIFPGVPDRVVDLLPDVRLVYIVRDPVERLRSMYLHQLANGRETDPIDVVVRTKPYLIGSSRYAWQLDRWEGRVAPERIKVITAERLFSEGAATVASVCEFVGVDPQAIGDEFVHRGRTDDKRVARGSLRRVTSVPGYAWLAQRAPDSLRQRARRLSTKTIDVTAADLDPGLERDVRAQLAPDVERMRRWIGDDVDRWGPQSPERGGDEETRS